MEYVVGIIVGTIALVVFARWRTRVRARKLVFEVVLPQLVSEQMPDADLGKISAYIWAHQNEMFDDLAINCGLGTYGARMALEKLNYIQALSNSDQILERLDGLTGKELLPQLVTYILEIEGNQKRT